jgi:hypothetical protein
MKQIKDGDVIQGNIVPYMVEVRELKKRIQELEKARPVEIHNHYISHNYEPGQRSWSDEICPR